MPSAKAPRASFSKPSWLMNEMPHGTSTAKAAPSTPTKVRPQNTTGDVAPSKAPTAPNMGPPRPMTSNSTPSRQMVADAKKQAALELVPRPRGHPNQEAFVNSTVMMPGSDVCVARELAEKLKAQQTDAVQFMWSQAFADCMEEKSGVSGCILAHNMGLPPILYHNEIGYNKEMDPFGSRALTVASVMSTLLAIRAVKKKSLTPVGAVTGFAVGFLLVSTGLRGLTLFFFYQLGSWATKYKTAAKAAMDETVSTASVRGASQVLAVSILSVVLSLYHAMNYGAEQEWSFAPDDERKYQASRLSAAILAHHAISLGDTLASEMGMATGKPQKLVRLVLPPFPLVPPGTNGGVTINGTVWSIAGGFLCAVFNLWMDSISNIWPTDDGVWTDYVPRVLLYGAMCGGIGSLLDSILGATVQMTYFDDELKKVCHEPEEARSGKPRKHIAGFYPLLSNEGVNFASVVLTSFLGGWVLAPLICR